MRIPRTPEFNVIAKYFTRPVKRAHLSIGDDCALIDVTPGKQLAISTDTLVSNVHFFADAAPEMLGHKALAVNLSDLAAMGATPRYFTLAITLPAINETWLGAFAAGMFRLADQFEIELIGGDTTNGPLSMTLTVIGQVAPARALRRDNAKAGDDIWVSGSLGGAALALKHLQGKARLKPSLQPRALAELLMHLHMPQPRVALGMRLAGVANAAIDISDGLIADLGHIATRSNLGARINYDSILYHPALLSVKAAERNACMLAGGDDYELCFTAPLSAHEKIRSISSDMGLALTNIGIMTALDSTASASPSIALMDANGVEMDIANLSSLGFDHFAARTVTT